MRFGLRVQPRATVISLILTILAMVPDALFAVAMKVSVEAVLARDGSMAALGAGLVTATVCGGWALGVYSQRVNRVLQLSIAVALERRVAELMSSTPSLRHQEEPELLDRLAVLRDAVGQLGNIFASLFAMAGAVARLAVIVALLVFIHPLLILLSLFAIPVIWLSSWQTAQWRSAEEANAPHRRQARHLYELGMSASTSKELRLGVGLAGLADVRHSVWLRWYRPISWARRRYAMWESVGWAIFSLGYLLAVAFALTARSTSPGIAVLLIAAGGRLAQYVNLAVGQMTFLRMWVEATRRLLWLENYCARVRTTSSDGAPAGLGDGLRFERVSFSYGDASKPILKDLSCTIPAGATVALVGENGAGKTTLIKLLTRFYEPEAGTIKIGPRDLRSIDPGQWRRRISATYQDFCKFEFSVGEAIGVGDLDALHDTSRIMRAARDARADRDIEAFPSGLRTQLGGSWPDGRDLSYGQWQRLAVARCRMRVRPELVMLDEPAAALDADTEAELFERFVSQASEIRQGGGIVLFVSHRLSTAKIADIVLVLADGSIVESGKHAELIASGGTYSEMYELQAKGYE